MVWIPGGTFLMGSDDFYPEERPAHPVHVSGFWMDEHTVTVAAFARFAAATGYVTLAERTPDPAEYPGAPSGVLVPGSLVFRQPGGPVPLSDPRHWWSWVPGTQWRHPEGPGSTVHGREGHPVTHLAYEDAAAYAGWAGKALPSEAEWERAARGGLDGAVYCWGDDLQPGGQVMANTWHGRFPWESLKAQVGTAPVRIYPPNSYGLFEMTGNVWEWTSDYFRAPHPTAQRACCAPEDPRADKPWHGDDGLRPDAHIPRRVVKGGSYLCSPSYCFRYRPAARQGQAVETSSAHVGFRCVLRVPEAGDDGAAGEFRRHPADPAAPGG
jgi:formylglycine-generating enzyme required for sulfatase activity